ncbi:MAG: adenylate/guanylate cyclase domain-containing protein [Pseudomonadota bacterium]
MGNARLVEVGLMVANALFVALAVLVGATVSVTAGILVVVLFLVASLVFIYNFDAWLVRRLSTDHAPLMLSLCQTGFVGRARRVLRLFPSDPRCRFCLAPFGGLGRLLHIRPAPKNPNFCRSCFEGLPTRTFDLEVGVLFADIRGFTAFSEANDAAKTARLLERFYGVAGRTLTEEDALVDYIGDQVMALYVVSMPSLGDDTAAIMVTAADRLIRALRESDPDLVVGVGLNIGMAQVGTLSQGSGREFTAVGDVVNTAARLQAAAGAGEILMTERVRAMAGVAEHRAAAADLDLKGKSDLVRAWRISLLDQPDDQVR